MSAKDKEKSLLEIAKEVLYDNKKPMEIMQIAKETMQRKGMKTEQGKELMPRFICDFMESGYFVYCDAGLWDLKERQPLSVINKDTSDYGFGADFEEEVKANELKSEDDTTDAEDEKKDDDDIEPEEDEIENELKQSGANRTSIESENVILVDDIEAEEEE